MGIMVKGDLSISPAALSSLGFLRVGAVLLSAPNLLVERNLWPLLRDGLRAVPCIPALTLLRLLFT